MHNGIYFFQIPANLFRFIRDELKIIGQDDSIRWLQLDYDGPVIPDLVFKNGKLYFPVEAEWSDESFKSQIQEIVNRFDCKKLWERK